MKVYCFIIGKGSEGIEIEGIKKTEEEWWKEVGIADYKIIENCLLLFKKKENFGIDSEINKKQGKEILRFIEKEIKNIENKEKIKNIEISEIHILVHAQDCDSVYELGLKLSLVSFQKKEIPCEWYGYTTAGGGDGNIKDVKNIIKNLWKNKDLEILNILRGLNNVKRQIKILLSRLLYLWLPVLIDIQGLKELKDSIDIQGLKDKLIQLYSDSCYIITAPKNLVKEINPSKEIEEYSKGLIELLKKFEKGNVKEIILKLFGIKEDLSQIDENHIFYQFCLNIEEWIFNEWDLQIGDKEIKSFIDWYETLSETSENLLKDEEKSEN